MTLKSLPAFATIVWREQAVNIEYQWIGDHQNNTPLIIFLHEGLGSLSMWRDFPQKLCHVLGTRGLVYSRPAYGKSTQRAIDENWKPDFMHRQAYEVLPALLQALNINPTEQPLWLLGHSDGGSIALLYAAAFSHQLQGIVVLAPHIFVEDLTIQSIEQAKTAYLTTDLPSKLARYHDNPESAFWGWNTIWLNPEFRAWSIEKNLDTISCPLLAIQGLEDEYGTLEQIHGISRRLPHTKVIELPNCGHSPHRDQQETLIAIIRDFIH